MSWVTIGVTVVTVGTTVGMAATGAGQPTYPNTAASSAGLANINAALLPYQRGMTAAMQSGGDYTFRLGPAANPALLGIKADGAGWVDPSGRVVSTDPSYGANLRQQAGGTGRGHRAADWTYPQSLTWHPGTLTMGGVPITQNKDGSYTVSFKGKGLADVKSAEAKQNAANQLALSQKYDPQFIAEALKQQKLADPESFAAREEEAKLIQDQINRPLNSPVSDMLNSQVRDTLDAAGNNKLTGMDTERLNAAVQQAQSERGGAATPADFASPLTSGFAGEQRKDAAMQGAMGFLASGSSPEDIAYRREQQNLANLSAEVNGKTPQSQFASMSGAQNGPTPMAEGNPLPVLPGGQDQAAAQNAIQLAQTTNRYNAGQANPWMTGVSSLINLGSVAGGMGWKPGATGS